MRLEAEPDIAVLAVRYEFAEAIDAACDPRADVLILGSALLARVSEEALGELRRVTGVVKVVLVIAASDTTGRRLASAVRAVEVVSQLESPDRLLAAVRSVTR